MRVPRDPFALDHCLDRIRCPAFHVVLVGIDDPVERDPDFLIKPSLGEPISA